MAEVMEAIPGHVPPELVRDLDIYSPPGMQGHTTEDVHALWKDVQANNPPLFWTPRHGGHWIATRYTEIERMLREFAIFSSAEPFIPRDTLPLQLPVQLDPPEHMKFRKLLMPAFSPKMLASATDRARRAAIEIIERIRPRGECEFVVDFAGTMPVIAFLTLVNLPEEDYAYLRGLAIHMSKPTHPKSPQAWAEVSEYVRHHIELRKKQPQDDLISSMLVADVGGRKMTDEEIFAMCLVVVGGGLDTVVSMTSFAACYLAQHPEKRHELIENPEYLADAPEEIARRFGTSNLGRIVRADTVLGGVELRAGDMIVGIFPTAGLDETVNPDPMTLDFTRKGRRHLAFGTGVHTCIGNNLARREIRIFLEEWVARIPDFRLTPGKPPQMTTGLVNSMESLHLSWDV